MMDMLKSEKAHLQENVDHVSTEIKILKAFIWGSGAESLGH